MLVGVTGRLACLDRAVQGGALFGLDGDHPQAVPDRRPDPADQPSAADRDDDRVRVGCVLLDLEADGAGAGQDERVVEGMTSVRPVCSISSAGARRRRPDRSAWSTVAP